MWLGVAVAVRKAVDAETSHRPRGGVCARGGGSAGGKTQRDVSGQLFAREPSMQSIFEP